jgi:hypothetical protein
VAGVLSNVAIVHAAVAACGGVERARQVAEAVGAYLEVIDGLRTTPTGA